MSISPRKNQNRNQFVFLSFGVDPLNWPNFTEIDETVVARLPGALVDALKLCFEWGITLFLASDTFL